MVQHMKIYQYNPPYKQTDRGKKNHMFISLEKAFDKIQHSFHGLFSLGEVRDRRGPYVNTIKAIYIKTIGNIKLNEET